MYRINRGLLRVFLNLKNRTLYLRYRRILPRISREIGDAVLAGINLQSSLSYGMAHPSKIARSVYSLVSNGVQKGRKLSDTFAPFAPSEFLQLLRSGEATGQIGVVLMDYAEYSLTRREQRQAIIKALSYPVLLLCLLSGLVVFLGRVVLPTFANLYAGLGFHEPDSMYLLAEAFRIAPLIFFLLLACFVLSLLVCIWLKRYRTKTWRYVVGKLPWYPVLKMYRTRTFLKLFHLLLNSGIAMREALMLLQDTMPRDWLSEQAASFCNKMMRGLSVSEVFSDISTDLTIQGLLRGAERTGDLTGGFFRMHVHIDRKIKHVENVMFSYLEPILILWMGFVVGGAMMLVFGPMYQLITTITQTLH